jgi:hypothetical protein
VIAVTQQFQIAKAIIGLVAITMVNVMSRGNRPISLFPDGTMEGNGRTTAAAKAPIASPQTEITGSIWAALQHQRITILSPASIMTRTHIPGTRRSITSRDMALTKATTRRQALQTTIGAQALVMHSAEAFGRILALTSRDRAEIVHCPKIGTLAPIAQVI